MPVKRQNFNPDNVMLYQAKDGSIPEKYNRLIVEDVIQNSKVMQLGKFEQMDGQEKKFEFMTKGPGAYWVGEGQKIQTDKPTLAKATMRAHKLGVIVVASREYLKYSVSDFFAQMQPKIAEAFYKKFDEAAILNKDNPFTQSIDQSATTANNVVKDAISYNSILSLEDAVLAHDLEPNAFISKRQNRTALRGAVKTENGVAKELFDRQAYTLDGLPIVDLKSDELKKDILYTGDFNYLYYGIPYGITYAISTEGQLSTITNEDGTPVNLFEQELIALRATMDVGMMIVKDEAFARLEPKASRG